MAETQDTPDYQVGDEVEVYTDWKGWTTARVTGHEYDGPKLTHYRVQSGTMQYLATPGTDWIRPVGATHLLDRMQLIQKVLPPAMALALNDVITERKQQDDKWGDQSVNPDYVWMLVLVEEIGEIAKAILHTMFGGDEAGREYPELTQATAVGLAWLEAHHIRAGRASD